MKQNATLKIIASTLNISVSTVSRAMQDNQSISLSTRKKVKELAKALDYEPHNFAVQLRTNNSKLFGLIAPSISSFFYNSFIAAVEHECSANGYSLLILQAGEDQNTLTNSLYMCRQNRVNGIFLCTDSSADMNEFFKLKEHNIPVIFFDKTPETTEYHKVCLEDEKAARLAAEYILAKKKKNILALFGNRTLSITEKRLGAFKNCFLPANKKIQLIIETDIDFDKATQCTMHYLLKDKNIDCVFCMSDEILAGSMRAILESGKKYPDEIGIIAISHGFFPTLYFPAITYIETNGSKLGVLAFKQMIACIKEEKKPEEIYLKAVLVEGGSM